MLRPLLITENFPPARGGMAQSCDRIVRALRLRGVSIDVVHLDSRPGTLKIEQHERGRLIRCPLEDDPAHAINLLWNVLAREGAAATHVLAFGGALPLTCAPAFAAWLQVPLITLLRGNDFDTGLFSPGRGWILRDALARSAAVCTVSTDHRDRVSSLYPEQHVAWIPNGIDASEWALLDIDRAQAQAWRAAQVAPGTRVLGLFGHLKRKKGGSLFLDALAGCVHAMRLHLLVVGEVEDEMRERLQALPASIAWSHVPFQDRLELLRWYAACDTVAIPSLYDGMPNVALEAGALGISLLASRAGGLPDLVNEDDGALLFAPGDLYDCRRALDDLALMPAPTLHACGERLRASILRRFDHGIEAQRYHELLLATAPPASAHAHAATVPMENSQ